MYSFVNLSEGKGVREMGGKRIQKKGTRAASQTYDKSSFMPGTSIISANEN